MSRYVQHDAAFLATIVSCASFGFSNFERNWPPCGLAVPIPAEGSTKDRPSGSRPSIRITFPHRSSSSRYLYFGAKLPFLQAKLKAKRRRSAAMLRRILTARLPDRFPSRVQTPISTACACPVSAILCIIVTHALLSSRSCRSPFNRALSPMLGTF